MKEGWLERKMDIAKKEAGELPIWMRKTIQNDIVCVSWSPEETPADVVCTGGSSSTRCLNPVSPDDPDDELCHECMQVEILKLEEELDGVMKRLLRYRRAVK